VLKVNNFDKDLIKKYIPEDKWEEAFKKLEEGYPVQYLIGNVEFYGTIIDVNENVLIPRFETEYLVDDLINLIKEYNFSNPKILDIGTGSGCISIALKKNIKCSIMGIDKSNSAIEVAKHNALKNKLDITFENISIEEYASKKKYDIIVSNPPYVRFDEEVDPKTKYEPQEALFAGDNGLYFYKLIINKSKELLNKKSIIAFEIGNGQASDIILLVKKVYPEANIISKKDLNGFERYIYIINE
jgi:release factor glutamine methyltransferase